MIAGHRLPPCYRQAGRAALVSASAQCQWPVTASEAGAGHDYVAVVRERPHLGTPAALRRSGQAAEAGPGWRRLAVLVQRQVWPRRRRLRWRSSGQAVSDACATRSMLWTALSARGLGHRPASLAFGTVHWRTRSRLFPRDISRNAGDPARTTTVAGHGHGNHFVGLSVFAAFIRRAVIPLACAATYSPRRTVHPGGFIMNDLLQMTQAQVGQLRAMLPRISVRCLRPRRAIRSRRRLLAGRGSPASARSCG